MEPDIRVLPPETVMERLLPLVDQGQTVPLRITGSSMFPFLVHGRDTVFLSKCTEAPRVGDMVLYRRASGQYILHRIVKIRGNTYDLLGDRQILTEPGIRREQILAAVTAVRRGGKLRKPGHPVWEFFRGPWRWLRPLRLWLIRAYCLVTGQKIQQ